MIKIQESVPGIYYNSSRDFQLLGHLFDLVLNSVKTEADMLFNLPLSTNSDDQLLDLMTFTLGLRLSKAKYTSRQLRAICSVAPAMMKYKGSLKAIKLLCTALMRADSVKGSFLIVRSNDGTQLTIYTTSYTTCRDALQEVLPYIVPAGINFNIKSSSLKTEVVTDLIGLSDELTYCVASEVNGKLISPTEINLDSLKMPSEFEIDTSGEEKSVIQHQSGTLNSSILIGPDEVDDVLNALKILDSEETSSETD